MKHDVQKILQQWQLSHLRSFTHLAMTNNYVVVAYSDLYKQDVVLKVGPKKVIDKEIQALQYFQGDACVKLLAFDCRFSGTNSALLLEYVQPGNSLKDLFLHGGEEASIEIFADIVKKIQKKFDKKNHKNFKTIVERLILLYTFESKNERLAQLLLQAAKLSDQLVATQGVQYLLHGDLHHENILKRKIDNIFGQDKGRKRDKAESENWVMIDPQGIVGELEYEVGAFIRNPLFQLLDQPNLEQLMLYRFERLSKLLHFDKQRMIDWSFVQAVLAACFAQQDQNERGQNYFLTVAELIIKL